MISKGEIYVDGDGIDVDKIDVKRRNYVIESFCDMREAAMEKGDKFFRPENDQWNSFYCHVWGEPSFDGVDENHVQMLQTTFTNAPIPLPSHEVFHKDDCPQTYGGFDYEGHPLQKYIYDILSWQTWHDEWFSNHQELIVWDNIPDEGVFPCPDAIIVILRKELLKDPSGHYAKTIKGKEEWRKRIEKMSNSDVIREFEDNVLKKMSGTGRIISYTKEIGEAICRANHYREEPELAQLEKDHGNAHVSVIYSMIRNGNYIFLSFDTQHGKCEVCNGKGEHVREISFSGVETGGCEGDHSLRTIAEWRKIHNR